MKTTRGCLAVLLLACIANWSCAWAKESIQTAIEIVQKATDDELVEMLRAIRWDDAQKAAISQRLKAADFYPYVEVVRDLALSEVIARGNPDWERRLKEIFEQINETNEVIHTSSGILTALRRIQKKPDPLQIEVSGPQTVEFDAQHLPSFNVALVNQDKDAQAIVIKAGGDYRSGRQERWRFEVASKDGVPIAPIEHFGDGIGGGIFSTKKLSAGDAWRTELHMQSFIEALTPGEYSLRIQYHDEGTIADLADLTGRIVSSSAPLKLIVKPLIITASAQVSREAKKLFRSIGENDRLRVVEGTYSEAFHDFVAPESPQGQILQMGLRAVPALLEELDSGDLSVNRRAWAFSLLYSLTGQNDPKRGGILGSYEARKGGWRITGGDKGDEPMGFGVRGSTKVSGAEPDPDEQRRFAQRWKDWRATILIKEGKD